jgi:cytochrome c peroxidase
MELRRLNPPGASGTAPLRRWQPPSDATHADYAYDRETSIHDQINCLLRDVGTFPRTAGLSTQGVSASTAHETVREVRDDMTTLAVGASGFNVPSLLGLAVGAPYFHAGNARTLEELFDPAFASHHAALAPAFAPDPDTIANLTAFLLSIDEQQAPFPLDPVQDLCANVE